MKLLALVDEAHAAHVTAHGAACGVRGGTVHPTSPCHMVRRAWVLAHPEQARREAKQRYRASGGAVREAAYHRTYHAAHRDELNARSRRYEPTPEQQGRYAAAARARRAANPATYAERGHQNYLAHREARLAYDRARRLARSAAA